MSVETRSKTRFAKRSELQHSLTCVEDRILEKQAEIKTVEKNEANLFKIKNLVNDIDKLFVDLKNIWVEYCETIGDSEEKDQETQSYFDFNQTICSFLADVKCWINLLEIKCDEKKRYQSSHTASGSETGLNVGSGSRKSSRTAISHKTSSSCRSIVSARAKAAAKRAALEIEAQTLKEKQQLDEEDLKLKQKKEELLLRTEIAKADAEEKVYTELELEGINSCYEEERQSKLLSLPNEQNTQQDILAWVRNTQTQGPIRNQVQNLNQPKVTLNPHASEWRPREGRDEYCSNEKDYRNQGVKVEDQPRDTLLYLMNENQNKQQQLIDSIQLPKTELMTFDGDPLKYWMFMRAFQNSVERETIDSNAKLMRLLQYCTGKALKVIQSCAVMEPDVGFAKAKELLRERFGNDYTILETWIQRMSEYQNIKPSDREGLQEYSDDLKGCKDTLQAMGKLQEINNQHTLVRFIEKLPKYLQIKWRGKAREIRTFCRRSPDISDVVVFVEAAAEEANDPVFGRITECRLLKERVFDDKRNFTRKKNFSNFNLQANHEMKQSNFIKNEDRSLDRRCVYCNNNHTLFGCEGFKRLKPEERLKFTHEKRLCDNCLIPGHIAVSCRRNTTCSVPGCGKKHTKFLHVPFKATSDNTEKQAVAMKADTAKTASNGFAEMIGSFSCNKNDTRGSRVALPIVAVRVRSKENKMVETYALLDSGSTNTFCSDYLIQQLGIHGKKSNLLLTTLESENKDTDTMLVSLEVTDMDDRNMIELPCVYTRPVLPINVENIPVQEDVDRWEHLKGIKLPSLEHKKVELLIGQDVPAVMAPIHMKKGRDGREPYAVKTILGWALNGPLEVTNRRKVSVNFIHGNSLLENQVERFWRMDVCESNVGSLSVNDKKVMTFWKDTVVKKNGHYEMAIPFRHQPPSFPNNKALALHRLRLLSKRFHKDEALFKKYSSGINDLLVKGYAMKVPTKKLDKDDGSVWYIPHHPVFQEKKNKIRIVFDCAAKYKDTSINQQVLQGPDLTNKLVGVLLRFREEPVALMSDIEMMFYQVNVREQDRDVLRFLWWPDNNLEREPEEFQMTVHLFGGVWSPSCASLCLRKTADDNKDNYDTDVINTVYQNFYVDDCLRSVSTPEQGIHLFHSLSDLLQQGGFHLTKWTSNNRQVLMSIPEEERSKQVRDIPFDKQELPVEHALGIKWDTESDKFGFRVEVKGKPQTRRGILSTFSSVYDPLGFVSPFLLLAKRLAQELCRKKLGWDDELPDTEINQWEKWLRDLPKIEEFTIPRCVKPKEFTDVSFCQLHHFSDASQIGYGTASYIRFVNSKGKFHCTLLMGKSRLSPLKSITIPRLELSAAVLSVKMDKMIRHELNIPVQDSFFWTDSILVLQYIENEDKRFQTFVANRLAIIHEGSNANQWHYVDSKSNPADDVSRGMEADKLISCERWVNGPEFLHSDEICWPVRPDSVMKENPDFNQEIKRDKSQIFKVCVVEIGEPKGPQDKIKDLFEKHSSWIKLKRSVAWILKVKRKLAA